MKTLLLTAVMMLSFSYLAGQETSPYKVKAGMTKDGYFYLSTKNKQNKTILLNKLGIPLKSGDTTQQIPLNKKKNDEMSIPLYYDMLTYFSQDNTIYVLLAYGGEITLNQYHIEADTLAQRTQYLFDQHHLMSRANGGDVKYHTQLKRIDNTLYMYVNGGQMFGGGNIDALYTFSLNAAEENRMNKITIEKPHKRIWTYRADDFIKQYYEHEKKNLEWLKNRIAEEKNKKTKKALIEELEEIKTWMPVIEKHLDKPYYLKELSNDEPTRKVEKNNMTRTYLAAYPLFGTDIAPNLDNADDYLLEVLTFADIRGAKPAACFFIKSQWSIVFLYKHGNQPKMLLYNRGEKEWQFVDYTSKPQQPRQLYFKATEK